MELIKKYKQGKLTTSDLRTINHIVICLMVFNAVISLLWCVSLQMLSGDLREGIVSAKLIFRERNFDLMNEHSKDILHKDFLKATQSAYGQKYSVQEVTPGSPESESQNARPSFKISHIYESLENKPKLERLIADQKVEQIQTTTTAPTPKIVFNAEADRQFLRTMSLDTYASYWKRGIGAQFVNTFPVISVVVAIIWTAMCLIFQTGRKKNSVLPKPWRIVVPSIVIFSVMSLGSILYTILTNGHLKRLCGQLRGHLTNPTAISCGDAIALLRPIIHDHNVSHDAYLDLFRSSYVIVMVLWIVALFIMVLRFVFAVDFQLVDIDEMFDQGRNGSIFIQPAYTEVLQKSSPQHQKPARPKSEDDYQSARSHISDLAVPLLEVQSQSQIPPPSLA
ncbi:uncharacterized protein Dana_GF23264, isoform B [Drosophila ananassae]|uniref:Uncharacterized protein, isoform B n=1 Tax=Drosophila ananassae TaxID=7217 RepID=A0A0P9A2V4_DROAN|nr:uncharacterized protein LOC6505907 isoform X2 [Drosophila ananassae]XP_032305487.1 uncharacterized protein LOC6505907 isoform X2 [Drosophila ananassae]XP_032305488.1 uncharacterized protein LOC6505907 isoform X2 [Drosophila ananassae]XP_044570434.1 uncharacterized protein LOC6505907 isoform X2 [Drosophila ananassae]KPU72825.1 uncharacterized protein Dana_GF23264, isoform B [Drosophila ananassae]